jgi:hypothetical protein
LREQEPKVSFDDIVAKEKAEREKGNHLSYENDSLLVFRLCIYLID